MKISLSAMSCGLRNAIPIIVSIYCLINLITNTYVSFSAPVPGYINSVIICAFFIFFVASLASFYASLSIHETKLQASFIANNSTHLERAILRSHFGFLAGAYLGLFLLAFSIATLSSQSISISFSDITVQCSVTTIIWHFLAIILFIINLCLLIADHSKSTTRAST